MGGEHERLVKCNPLAIALIFVSVISVPDFGRKRLLSSAFYVHPEITKQHYCRPPAVKALKSFICPQSTRIFLLRKYICIISISSERNGLFPGEEKHDGDVKYNHTFHTLCAYHESGHEN